MGNTIDQAESERRFYEIDARLKALTDSNPHAAIEAARALTPDGVLNQESIDALASGNLIDAGIAARDGAAVDEGIRILERLAIALPQRGDIQYCLANGLSAQAGFNKIVRPQWYLATEEIRQRARRLYKATGSNQSNSLPVRAQSYTNLGNSLLCAYRLVEAYDCYTRALEFDPTNGIALTGAARILIRLARLRMGNPRVLLSVAAKHLAKAKENPDRIRELAGEQAYQSLSKLLETDIPAGALPDLSTASQYQRFVAKHRLALAPTIEGLDLAMSRWDSIRIRSVSEHINAGDGVPLIFAMFNVLKSEFLVARYLAYLALNETIPESGKYSDTLDYANYGIRFSLLTLAQRACLDLLDKVAVAASEYFGLPGRPTTIYFTNRWFSTRKSGEPLCWHPRIQDLISRGNTALIAISEVSIDIKDGGFLQQKRAMRNSSTHRFAILHDSGRKPDLESPFIDHYSSDEFTDQLIETLQLSRAVLLYFIEMVALNEHLTHDDGVIKVPLFVPDHDWVRGEDA